MTRLLLTIAAATFASAAGAQDVTVNMSEWKLRLSTDSVPAGTVTFNLRNQGVIAHALQVTGPGVDKGSRQVNAKETATLTLTLKPGTYEVFCPLAEGSHKMAGMKKSFIVTAAAVGEKKPGA
jgi:plastocyanin